MTIPLIILAVGALFAGYLNLPAIFSGHQQVSHFLAPSLVEHHPHGSHMKEWLAVLASVVAFVIGLGVAYKKFAKGAEEPVYTGFARFAERLFRVDELYHNLFVNPYQRIGDAISDFWELYIVNLHVRISAFFYRLLGDALKALQVGYVRVYAIYMIIGLSLMSLLVMQTLN